MTEAKYVHLLSKLYQVNKFKTAKQSLENMLKVCELEGNPQNKVDYIHIAGTNGKGSVTLKCAKVLQKYYAGQKSVGLYTSPHISSFRERITVDSELISKDFICEYLEHLFALDERKNIGLTYFEFVTMMAFKYFEQQKVQIAALETGLGGLLDATNVVNPKVSVITSIGLDHVETLGPTVYDIAKNKAGVIKQGKPVVLGYNLPYEIFAEKAKETGSEIHQVKETAESVVDFDLENQLMAKLTLETLGLKNFSIKDYQKELEATPPCRLEKVPTELIPAKDLKKCPYAIYLDVGHNPAALDRALMTLSTRHQDKTIRVVYGASAKKDVYSCFEKIVQYASKIHIVVANHGRAMQLDHLIEEKENVCESLVIEHNAQIFEEVIAKGDIAKTLDYAFKQGAESENEEIVLIGGTFFMMQEVRDYFGIPMEADPYELNEIQMPKK